jgi:hypothetical protein
MKKISKYVLKIVKLKLGQRYNKLPGLTPYSFL